MLERWLAKIDDAIIGPLTDDEFVYLRTHGDIQPESLVQLVGHRDWVPASQVADITAQGASIDGQDQADIPAYSSPAVALKDVVQVYHIFTYVAGIQFPNSDGTSRQEFAKTLNVGQQLELIRDRDNSHDPNAVKVLMPMDRQIGFLPRKVAIEVAPLHELGWKYGCFVTSLGEEWEYDADNNETELVDADVLLIGAGPSATDADAQAYFNTVVRHLVAIRYPNFPLPPM